MARPPPSHRVAKPEERRRVLQVAQLWRRGRIKSVVVRTVGRHRDAATLWVRHEGRLQQVVERPAHIGIDARPHVRADHVVEAVAHPLVRQRRHLRLHKLPHGPAVGLLEDVLREVCDHWQVRLGQAEPFDEVDARGWVVEQAHPVDVKGLEGVAQRLREALRVCHGDKVFVGAQLVLGRVVL